LSQAKLLDDGAAEGLGLEGAACGHTALGGDPEPVPARAVKSTL
jgi:hypothetical protein